MPALSQLYKSAAVSAVHVCLVLRECVRPMTRIGIRDVPQGYGCSRATGPPELIAGLAT
jgi:hypothetical protein